MIISFDNISIFQIYFENQNFQIKKEKNNNNILLTAYYFIQIGFFLFSLFFFIFPFKNLGFLFVEQDYQESCNRMALNFKHNFLFIIKNFYAYLIHDSQTFI